MTTIQPRLSQQPGSNPQSLPSTAKPEAFCARKVLCACALGPRSLLGEDGRSRSLSPAWCRSQIRRETLLGGCSPIPGIVRRGIEARVTEGEQEPENELAAGRAGTRRPRGRTVRHCPSFCLTLTRRPTQSSPGF